MAVEHVARGDVARGKPHRVEPDAHGEFAPAEDLRVADAFDRGEARLHDLRQEFRHLLRVHRRRADGDIHQREIEAGALHDDRVLRVRRAAARAPAAPWRARRPAPGRDRRSSTMFTDTVRGAERARRGHVVDVVGVQHRLGDRRGDEALHQAGAGAGIDGGDGDHRFLDLRIFADGHVEEALDAEEQDQDRGDDRQDRPADEELGEIHDAPSPPSERNRRRIDARC